jgi:hypothetical protein
MIDEKVLIERLEEEKSDWNYDYNVPVNKAIEIVKKLASEHNNGFCEWKADEKFDWFIKSPHEGIGLTKEEHNLYKFCPYCGKKIKVVDAPYKKGE